MLAARIFGVLQEYDDEWIVLSREGVVVDHGKGLAFLQRKHDKKRASLTLLRVPPAIGNAC